MSRPEDEIKDKLEKLEVGLDEAPQLPKHQKPSPPPTARKSRTPEDEIKDKLSELEASLESASGPPAVTVKPAALASARGSSGAADDLSSDLHLCLGFGLVLLGCFLVMNHVQVGTGFMAFFGFHQAGFGLAIIPLMLGIGLLFFDYKSRLGWILTVASLALILFAVLSQLFMTFPPMSLLGLVLMFLPFAAGGALIAKGFQTRRGAKD